MIKNEEVENVKTDGKVKVWDSFVRFFHWSLLLLFATAFLTDFGSLKLHVFAGYGVALLITLRVVWGFIGGKNAKFTDFIFPPKAVIAHLKDMTRLKHKRYIGHNPAAGAMALVLIMCLAATTLTGVLTYGAKEISGPFAAVLLDYGWYYGKDLKEIHDFLAMLTLVLAVLHVTGVAVESALHNENLVLSMITGYKYRNRASNLTWVDGVMPQTQNVRNQKDGTDKFNVPIVIKQTEHKYRFPMSPPGGRDGAPKNHPGPPPPFRSTA